MSTPELSAGHSGLMDSVYRHQRHIYDLTRKYYLLGRDRMISELAPPKGGTVLELGCGTGRNLILAARRFPDAHFYGLDISAEMLVTARASIARAGLSDRISLAQGDATSFDAASLFGRAGFDRVFVSYSLSMIPGWERSVSAALAASTGSVHVVDFGQQEGLPGWFRKLLRRWLARFHVTPRETLASDIAAQARVAGKSCRFTSLYRGYAWLIVVGGAKPI
ncbi:methyltransferase domain-containing protein [Aminobacter sp. SR38]|jgi:S-adenosylmethionine-diacylgycerolhomoserine-N-methlytransferase|uniref:class I SAM-dependent methyltransferase n=1 Tax=Aminobacter TaxID=31988 RepID=UPI00178445D0|nr:class I SAM-dependent methyltransferase [Aminobacter sp. SR38]QOF70953.1 methyltransferase domain-containing protein [Aminobacter sp. SR38]